MLEFLLNPNIAYLLLMFGFLFAVLALLSPGTGVFEIIVLFSWLLAGWSIYNLPINLWALIVLLIGVFPFLLAVRKSGQMLFLIISIVALVIGSTFLFQGDGWKPAVHPILAFIVSSLSSGYFWVVTRKVLEAKQVLPSHDLGTLIGLTGVAKTDIHSEGSVYVAGEQWTARSEGLIPEDSEVKVIRREGLILIVEMLDNDK